MGLAFVWSVVMLVRDARPAERAARQHPQHLHLDPRRHARREDGLLRRSAVDHVDPARHRRRLADPPLFDRLHARRPPLLAVLRLPQPVRRVDADPRARLELPRDLPRLGGRRPLLVPADLVLVRAQRGGGRGQEGVRHQPRRRRRVPARDVPDLRVVRLARLRGDGRGRERRSTAAPRPRSRCCSSSPRSARARSSRCTSGSPTRWKAPRRSPR